ncbi:T9SS type A sorting domain-containing protein [Arenitalea sp.]|nr:T9SS type A sorting domain-containing protein [Algibacter sp.]MDA9070284.1 T9SS type A sorting domain-containing protein [Algibacter sp.]
MKKDYFIIFIALCCFSLNAQLDIPDSNFENYLETHNANGDVVTIGDASSMGDGVLNNLTLISKVEGVTELYVSENNIASLQGIEAFTNLEILHCRANQLEVLDISQNLALVELECESNQFSTLDVSNNLALKVLGFGSNNLSSIDVSNNLLLEAIWFVNNNISSLNLDVNTALRTYGLSNNPLVYMSIQNGNNTNVQYIEALNLPSLSCIQVDNATAATYLSTNFSFVDEGISFSEDCGTVYIPDNNFENYLETHNANGDIVPLGDATSMGDGVLNNLTLISKVEGVINLNVNDSNIANLQGLEAFTNLESLYCQRNQLENLDVSQNLNLSVIECESNLFTSLDVSNNTVLRTLGCALNNLSSLDVSNNLLLEGIWFTDNNIVSLNLDVNTALNVYGLSNNPLVYMSIKNGNNANVVYMEAQNLPTLSCIQVDDANAASYLSANFSFVDSSISFSENCGTVYIPDANFENYLETHNANGDVVSLGDATSMGDGVLNNLTLKSKVETVTSLIVNDSNIVSLQGVEGFTNLEYLNCNNNPMANLDVSQNANLDELSIDNLLITEIDLSNNLQLKYFYAVGVNNLTNIDFSVNTLLINLLLNNSKIEILNLSNNSSLTFLLLRDNLQLTYLNLRNNNNLNLINCDVTNNPNLLCINADANISQAMINTGNTFSEDCGDIWTVYTSDTNLDAVLSSYGSDIDTSGDGEITLNEAAAYAGTLDLSNQDITDIEGLQAFTSVTEINLSGNNISDLSVLFGSNAVVLTNKQAEFKTVTSSSFSALLVLDVSYNSLTSIDVSEITTLVELNCSNNLLNSLNIKNGNNAILTTFEASNNTALSCIQVDNVADASSGLGSYSAWNKDTFAIYSEDCSSALSTDDNNLITSLSIFPNPVKDVITVNAKQAIDNITIYNIMGQNVKSYKTLKNNQIDVSRFSKGFYILNAEINGAIQSLKFLKE